MIARIRAWAWRSIAMATLERGGGAAWCAGSTDAELAATLRGAASTIETSGLAEVMWEAAARLDP